MTRRASHASALDIILAVVVVSHRDLILAIVVLAGFLLAAAV